MFIMIRSQVCRLKKKKKGRMIGGDAANQVKTTTNEENWVRKAHKRVKFNQTEMICSYLLFMSRGVSGPPILTKRTRFNMVNLDNQLPKPYPPM